MLGGGGLNRIPEGSYCSRATSEPSGKERGGAMQRPGDAAAALESKEGDREASPGGPDSKGLAAGALLVAKQEAQAVRELLHGLSWLKKGKNVTTPTPEQLRAAGVTTEQGRLLLALHLNHAGGLADAGARGRGGRGGRGAAGAGGGRAAAVCARAPSGHGAEPPPQALGGRRGK